VTVSWAIDPGGDIRPVALDVADAIAKRVAAEVNRHREYAVILGLNATETDARLDGVAVAMQERCQAWTSCASMSFARTMVLSETPLGFDPDEVETIMRATSREVDDRVLSAQIAYARTCGFPMWYVTKRCEGPATLEVAQREMRARWWTHPQLVFDSLYYGGVPPGFTNRPR